MVPPRSKKRRRPKSGKPLPKPPEGLLPREAFVAATRDYFSILTRPIMESRTPETGGREFVSSYTRMVDTIVGVLFARAAERHGVTTDETGIAVIALGGYGRAELAPYSDVDLLILCSQKNALIEGIASSFIRLMWDTGFELGHAVESLVELESLSHDMDTKTALIESRWVCGSRAVAKSMAAQVARIRRNDREEYLRRKIEDTLARHKQFENSYQLIEPNIKLSPGGMRDFQTLVWLGQVGRQNPGLALLRRRGLLLRGEQRELEAAYDFLLRARIELHLSTESHTDQLTVASQRPVAKQLGYRDRGAHMRVEHFMREYYSQTRAIYRITVDVLEELGNGEDVGFLIGRRRPQHSTQLNLQVRKTRIDRDPLYVFKHQKASGRKFERSMRRRLEVALNEHVKGRKILNAMRRDFIELLRDDENVPLVIRSMHETRFLMKVIPEYDQMTCLKRYDLYHHYTVDEHSFKVLEHLADLGRSEANPADPMVRLYSEVADKHLLFLAALLHDVGKIEGRGHAKKGAKLCAKILKRMFVPEEDITFVCDLVKHHLIMSHYSQRRDPSDIGTIASFCKAIDTRTKLKHLCLLTYADYRATSPNVWSEWKHTLLWELYVRAYDYMTREAKQPQEVYKRHKQRLLASFPLGEERDRALKHLDMLPGGYLLTMTAAAVSRHMEMIDALKTMPFVVHVELEGSAYQVTFCTRDKPFRLSQLCGVLSICDFNILHAHAFTRTDGSVIDVFDVHDLTGAATWDEVVARMDMLRVELASVYEGRLDLREATERHAGRWRRTLSGGIPVEVKVEFENDVSEDFTIIDIFAPDRPGLLHNITHALSAQGLSISRARISTEANRAIDAFYVTDKGKKITAASRIETLRQSLADAAGE